MLFQIRRQIQETKKKENEKQKTKAVTAALTPHASAAVPRPCPAPWVPLEKYTAEKKQKNKKCRKTSCDNTVRPACAVCRRVRDRCCPEGKWNNAFCGDGALSRRARGRLYGRGDDPDRGEWLEGDAGVINGGGG